MKILGIIAEYNPFHLGHRYHLEKAKQIVQPDLTIVVMSGNITQRGEFAIVDKCSRAACAIDEGVDLVVELPFCYTNQQADVFAKRSIDILASLHVSDIVFGSECNDISLLRQVASLPIRVDHLKESMSSGASYAASLTYGSLSFASNDILAIAYLKALANYPSITPHTILRTNGYHDQQLAPISSAKAIRNAYFNDLGICDHTPLAPTIASFRSNNWNDYFPIIKHSLINTPINELKDIFLVSEGIETHLQKCAIQAKDYDEFIQLATTRRYTTSRIQRTLMNIINHIKASDIINFDQTIIHPLAFNIKGKDYLAKLSLDESIILMNRINQCPSQIKHYWINVDRNYYLFHPSINPLQHMGPVYVKK